MGGWWARAAVLRTSALATAPGVGVVAPNSAWTPPCCIHQFSDLPKELPGLLPHGCRSKLEALELAALAAKGLNGNLAGKQGEAQQQQQQGGSESSKAGSRAGDDTCIPVT